MIRQVFTVLVCGGRDYRNANLVRTILDGYAHDHGPIVLVQGGATGADEMARLWAARQNEATLYGMHNVPADWKAHGRKAGPIRNQLMLDEHKPHVVVAFPGGRGTEDMVRRAEAAGVRVERIYDPNSR